jgi:RNA polymerase sigma factor (sigma-70 family)
MKIPKNKTKAEVLEIIERIVNRLATNFKFNPFDVDDIKQEGRIFAMQALAKYDEARPLENFLYKHVRNRLINFKRDNYRRTDAPCKLCANAIDGETGHPSGAYCDKYVSWQQRNMRKQNVINPLDISNISDEKEPTTREESSVLDDVAQNELLKKIDERLPLELRSYYLQMRDGASVPKPKRLEVERVILSILGDDLCLSVNEEL